MPPNGNPIACVPTIVCPSALPVPTNVSVGHSANVFGRMRSNAPDAGTMPPTEPAPYSRRGLSCDKPSTVSVGGKNGSGGVGTKWNTQKPSRSTQGGATGEPPLQTPPVHVSPDVQTCPSSHAAPSADGAQVDGVPVHVKHGSSW